MQASPLKANIPVSLYTAHTIRRYKNFQQSTYPSSGYCPLFIGNSSTIDRNHIQWIPIESPHQTGMSIIRNGTQQRPYHTFIHNKRSIRIHPIAQHNRYLFPLISIWSLCGICLAGTHSMLPSANIRQRDDPVAKAKEENTVSSI